jgi:hypothetical protein
MVARLDLLSVSLAQKPKSAVIGQLRTRDKWVTKLTDLDVATGIKEDIVTLDVAMDDILVVQVFKSAASLLLSILLLSECLFLCLPQDRSWKFGPR